MDEAIIDRGFCFVCERRKKGREAIAEGLRVNAALQSLQLHGM